MAPVDTQMPHLPLTDTPNLPAAFFIKYPALELLLRFSNLIHTKHHNSHLVNNAIITLRLVNYTSPTVWFILLSVLFLVRHLKYRVGKGTSEDKVISLLLLPMVTTPLPRLQLCHLLGLSPRETLGSGQNP